MSSYLRQRIRLVKNQAISFDKLLGGNGREDLVGILEKPSEFIKWKKTGMDNNGANIYELQISKDGLSKELIECGASEVRIKLHLNRYVASIEKVIDYTRQNNAVAMRVEEAMQKICNRELNNLLANVIMNRMTEQVKNYVGVKLSNSVESRVNQQINNRMLNIQNIQLRALVHG